jgi:hypothetical protein
MAERSAWIMLIGVVFTLPAASIVACAFMSVPPVPPADRAGARHVLVDVLEH